MPASPSPQHLLAHHSLESRCRSPTCEPPSRRSPTCLEASGYCRRLLQPLGMRLLQRASSRAPHLNAYRRGGSHCIGVTVQSTSSAYARLPRRLTGARKAGGQVTQGGGAMQHAGHARSRLCCSAGCQQLCCTGVARREVWPRYCRRECPATMTQPCTVLGFSLSE